MSLKYPNRVTMSFTDALRDDLVQRLWAHKVTGHTDELTGFVVQVLNHSLQGRHGTLFLHARSEDEQST